MMEIGSDDFSSLNSINFIELFSNISEYYVAFYGTSDLYGSPNSIITNPQNAVLYYPFAPISDIRSSSFLQTFPTDKIIAVYSYSGHLSAMLTAYLRLLGYNAKSILFGCHNGLFYVVKNTINAGKHYAFLGTKNYPYVKE